MKLCQCFPLCVNVMSRASWTSYSGLINSLLMADGAAGNMSDRIQFCREAWQESVYLHPQTLTNDRGCWWCIYASVTKCGENIGKFSSYLHYGIQRSKSLRTNLQPHIPSYTFWMHPIPMNFSRFFTFERDFRARTASLRSSRSVEEATRSHSFWICQYANQNILYVFYFVL